MVEQVFRRDEVFLSEATILERRSLPATTLFSLFVCLLASYLVVCPTLVGVRETSHRCIYLFKRIGSLGRRIFIWVNFDSAPLERLLQISLRTVPINSQDLIVVFAPNDLLAYLNVLR